MKPPGPLMMEHRLIERMIKLLSAELDNMASEAEVNPHFIQTALDFLKTYADRTHHGKEEDILFRKLKGKKLSADHRQMMNSLIQEHVWARETVGQLLSANKEYIEGHTHAFSEIKNNLQKLIEFYPRHIEKEDKHFFIPVMEYFTSEQQEDMLEEYWEFDRKMIHEKYKKIVEEAEKNILKPASLQKVKDADT
jgi:hemerythrin-like domain-containing protein